MAGSQMKNRKGMRSDDPKGPAVTQHKTSGSRPKPMTSGNSRPASAWKISTPGVQLSTIRLVWIDSKDEWHMYDDRDRFVQEFFNCETLNRYFPGLDKTKVNRYEVVIKDGGKTERK